jgi:uncharacterized membrane protein HdeD (DUF308 family)
VYALVEGATSLGLAFARAEGRTGAWILHALVGIGAGILTFTYPALTAIALYTIIAGWAIATGIVELLVASDVHDLVGTSTGSIIFAGIVSILFGILLVALPAGGILALVGLIAAYAILSGIAWVAVGMRVHRLATP